MNQKAKKLLILGSILVIIDQIIKIWIKTHFLLGESVDVFGDEVKLLFVENSGMAFGMQWGGPIGKLFLTSFRIVFFFVLCYWINSLINKGAKRNGYFYPVPGGVLFGLTLITAGALGNIIDSMFYGIIFSESTAYDLAHFGGKYAPFMFGKVVDMFYFPLIDTKFPEWIPMVGGDKFKFFEPVFNFADSCVTVGAFYLALFHYKFFFSDK